MKKIDLLEFVPSKVKSQNNGKEYPLNVISDDHYIMLSYSIKMSTHVGPNAEREYSLTIPRYINWNGETFETLGFLQAGMGKINDGGIIFCNHEYQLINKVIKWFKKEIEISSSNWRWYTKINTNEPVNKNYKKEIEEKVTTHWINKIQQ